MSPLLLQTFSSLTDAFTDGTYPVRPFLLAGYAALLYAAYALFRRAAWARRLAPGTRAYRAWAAAGLLSLALLFATGMAAQAMAAHAYGIPERAVAVFFTGDEITGTRVTHTHFQKLAIAAGLKLVPESFVEQADTGSALSAYVPAFVPWAMLGFFLIALCSALLLSVPHALQARGKKKRLALMALYGMTTFILLDKSLDGGFLSDSAPLAFAVYATLLLAPHRAFRTYLAYAALAYAWLAAILFATGFFQSFSTLYVAAVRTAVFGTAAYALHGAAFGEGRADARRLAAGCALVLAIACIVWQGAQARRYLLQETNPGASWLAAYGTESVPALPSAGTLGRMRLYRVEAPSSVASLIGAYKLPYWYYPVAVESASCDALPEAQERFNVITPVPLRNAASQPASVARAVFSPDGVAPSGWYRYRATIYMNACLPRSTDVIREMVRLGGSDQAVAWGIGRYAGNAASGGFM